MPFKMHKTLFFPEKKKKIKKKYVCLPYLKFSDLLRETHIILFGLTACILMKTLTKANHAVYVTIGF